MVSEKIATMFERDHMTAEAREIIESDQTLWPTKHFSAYGETIQDTLKNFMLVTTGDRVALERLRRKHGAI